MNTHTLSGLMLSLFCALAGCTADASGPSPVVDNAPVRTSKHRVIVVGQDRDIAARRDALAVRRKFGVKAAAPQLKAGASKFIASSASIYANPAKDGELRIDLARDANGTAAGVASSIVSSDESVATAKLDGNAIVVASLTGKVGNAYLTTYDAAGNATAKVMVLAATPSSDVATVEDDANTAPEDSAEPSRLLSGDFGGTVLATDFQGLSSPDAVSALYTPAAPGHQAGAMAFTAASYQKFADAVRTSGVSSTVRAVYFSNKDLLVLPVNGDISATVVNGTYLVSIAAAVTQSDFGKYLDYGGNLSSSALRDPSDMADGSLSYTAGSGIQATLPVSVGVVLPNGRKVMMADAEFESVKASAVRQLVAYPQAGEPLGDALTCETTSTAGPIDWRSLYSTAETSFGGTADWKNGRADIFIGLEPHFRVGGQIGIAGHFEGSCEKTLFEVPLAEWGIPLLGNVSLETPVKLEFKVDATGTITVMTPRLELGSKADVTQPGKLGFSYKSDGGFSVDSDVAVQTPSPRTLSAVEGSQEGTASVKVEAGLAAGISLDATVKAWLFKADVRADIGEILFGMSDEASVTVKAADDSFEVENTFELGVFPTIAPTIQVNLPFFKASFNLFDLQLPNLVIEGDATAQKTVASLLARETPMTTQATDGSNVAYVVTPDHIEVRNEGDIASANVVGVKSYPGNELSWDESGITAGLQGPALNVTGTNLQTILASSKQAHYGNLFVTNLGVELHMASGKTVRIYPQS